MQATRFPARATGPAERIAGFMAHLRMNGLPVGVGETAAAMRALGAIDPTDADQARLALKAVCASRAEDFARFDELFAAYWMNRGRERERHDRAQDGAREASRRAPGLSEDRIAANSGAAECPDDDTNGEAEHSGEGRLVAARVQNIARTDLREFVTPEDVAAAEAAAERLARAIRDRRSRRRRAAKRGTQLDLRRVARASIATGGEPLRLFRKARPERPAKLVAILDVSGSMTVYARVFLAFLRGLTATDTTTDAYLFHTRLVRITDALRDRDAMRAVNRLSLLAQGFGGGTRIGSNLAAFNRGYARRLVGGRSVVIILSDGYDTDPPDLLGAELARLKKRGCRIVWLNPLKGWRDYAPVARGMAAALPHLDLFAAANTLDSLAALEPELARL